MYRLEIEIPSFHGNSWCVVEVDEVQTTFTHLHEIITICFQLQDGLVHSFVVEEGIVEKKIENEMSEVIGDWLKKKYDVLHYIVDEYWFKVELVEMVQGGCSTPSCIEIYDEDLAFNGSGPNPLVSLLHQVNKTLKKQLSFPKRYGWKELFQVTKEYQQLAPWTWMDDRLFAVQFPYKEDVYYCSFLGREQKVFGFSVIVGDEGLAPFLHLMEATEDAAAFDCLCRFNKMLLTFEDRSELTKEDVVLLKAHGVTGRGREKRIQYRRQVPGYAPWYFSLKDVHNFTQLLQVAITIAKQGPFYHNETMCYDVQNQQWIPLVENPVTQAPSIQSLSTEFLLKIKGSLRKKCDTFTINAFFLPDVIQDSPKQRPYFPYQGVIYLPEGHVISMQIGVFADRYALLQDLVIDTIEKQGYIPEKVIANEEIISILAPILTTLNISYIIHQSVSVLE